MEMTGTGAYEEVLPCGGKLRVDKNRWEIRYFFPGPDGRYRGAIVTVPGIAIDETIQAFEENFQEFEQLKAVIPQGSDFAKQGKRGMTIRIGFAQGVCIESHHMPIASVAQQSRLTEGYRYAARRAPQIQAFLASL